MPTSSESLLARSRRVTPGGVNTSLRRIEPSLVWQRSEGAYITDADGNSYLDYHAAFGPIVLGHCHPAVAAAVAEQQRTIDLIGVGATELEIDAAEKIVQHVPSAEQVLFCTSGSEATYHAVRLARAVTGRQKVIKFQGCYHGWHDYLLQNVITPRERLGQPDPLSAGMLPAAIEAVIVLDINDVGQLTDAMAKFGEQVAAIVFELIPHAIGCVMPEQSFLEAMRALASQYGSVLVFDEVVTGFRHGLGGYQAICGVTPDLTTLGKAMANGYPCAALAGRRDLMERFNTSTGNVFFSGTFNGHPLAMAACRATITELERPGFYPRLFALGERMRQGLTEIVNRLELEAFASGFGSVFVLYFMEPPARSYTDLLRNDAQMYHGFHRGMLERGFFMLPLNLKRNHISAAHTEADIDRTLEAADDVLTELARNARSS
ncbi:MAG: aspartate aminotransferase family protein [Actinobacteria bacterium]|nr:aspartate aminotransferase family protein [Actinomycetota bacterium]